MKIPAILGLVALTGLTLSLYAEQPITGPRGLAAWHAVVNFEELVDQRQPKKVKMPREMGRPANLRDRQPGALQRRPESFVSSISAPSQPSPAPATNFLAIGDDNTAIPPDTMGAVGPNHLMTTLNSQVRIQSKDGTDLKTVGLDAFWASVGSPDVYDPHITYDSFNNRWIFSGVANADSMNASVVVGVSATSDPTQNWYLYSVDVDAAGKLWADYDNLGFNKDWVVVTANIFTNGVTDAFDGVRLWVFDKSDLYTNGPGVFTKLEMPQSPVAFSVAPAQTHDNSLATMYLVEEWDGGHGELRVSTITGTVGSELLTPDTARPTTSSRWETIDIPSNLGPQLGVAQGIDLGDTRVLSCRYRDGALWVSQNAYLPLGTPTRCAAQWWQFLPDGTVEQFGRVDDPTGVFMYAYPSLAVNTNGDVLMGYNRFSSAQYVSANYSFRFSTDPPGTLRADTVLKDGEASYYDGGLNRWGDYSATAVDPADDLTLWTIQEYAAAGSSWGTWWGRIVPSNVALIRPSNGMSYPPSPTVTLSAIRLNTDLDFTKMEFFADTTKIGETTTTPFTITWNPSNTGTSALTAVATDTLGGVSTSAVINIFVGDLKSPVGTWQTKLRGGAKGNAVVIFKDDFTLSGYGMTLGTVGLFDITGVWGFDSKHQVAATYTETLGTNTLYSGTFTAKVKAGKNFSATVTPDSADVAKLKLKGIPLAPVPDISGSWSGSVTTAGAKTTESYQFTASATLSNIFFITGSMTGTVIETSKGDINLSAENLPQRTLSGKAKTTSFSVKGSDENGAQVKVKATKP